MKISKMFMLLVAFGSILVAKDITTLYSGKTKFGIANKHEYSHYKINASKGDVVSVKVHHMDADGDLYINIDSIATKDSWDYKSLHSKLEDEEQSFTLEGDATVYISVYANRCISTVEHEITVEINPNHKVKVFPSNPSSSDKFITYTPAEGISDTTPVVLFLNGLNRSLNNYEGLNYFLSQKGYFVIAVHSNSYDPKYSRKIFEEVINTTKKHNNLKLNRLAVIGHSLGGGNSFSIMKHFQDLGYGRDGSLVLSIEGWFPFGMKESDFEDINGHVAFLQMNGKAGTKDVDVLTNLTIWKLLKDNHKSFLTVSKNDHLYVEGDREEFSSKKDLLEIIPNIIEDAFTNSDDGYHKISSKYKATYQEIYKSIENVNYRGGCSGKVGNAISVLDNLGNDIDYCHPENY